MKKLISSFLVYLLFLTSAFSQTAIGDGNLKISMDGTEKIPVSGTGHPVINGNLLKTFILGGSSYILSSSAPTNQSLNWIDNSSTTIPQAYPIKRYINGAWGTETIDGDWWDDAGKVISKGRPYVITYSGQSNVASSFYFPDYGIYGTSYTGDVALDPYITVWNGTAAAFKVYDFTDQAGSTGLTESSWQLNLGTNNLQTMGKNIAKKTGRSIRFIGARRGGTALAAWEAGAPLWTELVSYINASGIKYADCFVWIHGEGELTDATYPTSLFANYKLSMYDMFNRLKTNSWTNGTLFDNKTIFLAPSQGLKHQYTVLPSGEAVNSEGAIRSLAAKDNQNTDWVQAPFRRAIQEPLAGKSTSVTSVNLTTVVAPFSITIGTGLSTSYPVSTNNPVAIVSRANRSNNLVGTISAYNNATGLLTFSIIEWISGAGAATDWDVQPQDRFHWTTIDDEQIGQAMATKFLSLPSSKKDQSPYQTFEITDSKGVISQSTITSYPSDSRKMIFTSATNNAGVFDFGFSANGLNPTTVLRFGATGSSSNSFLKVLQTGSGTELSQWNTFGLLQSSPVYWRYTGAASLDTRIEMNSDGTFGLNLVGGTTGSLLANIRMLLGATEVFKVFENAGNGYRYNFSGPNGGALYLTNSNAKLSRVVESRGSLSGAIVASGTQTSTIFVNTPITDIPSNSVIDVELAVVGLTSVGGATFSVKKSAIFHVAAFGTVVMDSEGPISINESAFDIVSNLTFSVVSGQISATLTRGGTAGTFNFSSIATATIKSF